MATVQVLKKKLRGIQSIQKVSKALKTASTVKFSRLNTACGNYSLYAQNCRKLYEQNIDLFNRAIASVDHEAPLCLVVMAGNKGMCGSLNSELLAFAEEQIRKEPGCKVLLCGKVAENWFKDHGISYEKAFVFEDVPRYVNAEDLFDIICGMLRKGEISGVELVCLKYHNMMKQSPERCTLMGEKQVEAEEIPPLFFPDKESVVRGIADNILAAFLYEKILECALCVQAATLMTMRSAYDTATEYSRQLEGEINRKRQSQVTADVIETSSEFSREVN